MDMSANFGAAHHAANVFAVFDDGIALGQILQRDLVADRNIGLGGQAEIRVVGGGCWLSLSSLPFR